MPEFGVGWRAWIVFSADGKTGAVGAPGRPKDDPGFNLLLPARSTVLADPEPPFTGDPDLVREICVNGDAGDDDLAKNFR